VHFALIEDQAPQLTRAAELRQGENFEV